MCTSRHASQAHLQAVLILRSQGDHDVLDLLVHLADELPRQLAQQQRGGQAVGQQLVQLPSHLHPARSCI